VDADALRSCPSVAAWAKGLREQWGGDPLAEEPERLQALADFSAFTGKGPDELVAFCFLRKRETGERFASAVRRNEIAATLRAFVASRGASGTAARRLVADVLSFFIHNGVLMTPAMVTAPAPDQGPV
jgi:hypothetical protein